MIFMESVFPIQMYEYRAAGKPIICCSSGQPGRYLSETKSGIVVKPGDCEALAEAILHLYRSREAAECWGKLVDGLWRRTCHWTR